MDGMSDEKATKPEEPAPIYASPEEEVEAKKKDEEDAESKRKADLVTQAKERFKYAEEAEAEVRRLAQEDLRFRAGKQWDDEILNQRKIDRRPALVINRMPQFERQITNELRQAKPAIQVSPIDSGADIETAEVIQGLVRHIEYDSSADVAYDTAATSAVRGGLGYIRLVTEYESEESFEQCIRVKRVRDPFSVYMDPYCQEPDGSDANYSLVVDDGISEEQFRLEYPDAEPVVGGWGDHSNNVNHTCQVVEYFYRERVADQLLVVQPHEQHPETGQIVPASEPITALRSAISDEDFAKMKVLSSRDTHRTKVCWAKFAGNTVVEEGEFPSKWIPVVPVLGDELWVDGKRILEGIVRNAKDPQRMYNYWSTAITETIALAPRAPWIGYEGQFDGHEKKWAEASRSNVPYLEVRPMTVDGKPAPLPTRNAFDAPIGAMVQAMSFASEDMKGTTGIYDAALGNRSNEQTGVAIRARQGQSQTSTLHFSDNLARALRHLGRIIVDAIPRVYSTARVVRILGEDQSDKLVGINGHPPQEGQERIFDFGTGRYDVSISMGASYTSKRQEAVAAYTEIARTSPKIAEVSADIMVRNMDLPGAEELAERLKKTLPPGIAEPDQKQKMDPGVLVQRYQQSQQLIEQLTKAHHQALDELHSREMELKSRERIALIQSQTQVAIALARADADKGIAMLDNTTDVITKQLEVDGMGQPDDETEETPPAPPSGAQPGAPTNGS